MSTFLTIAAIGALLIPGTRMVLRSVAAFWRFCGIQVAEHDGIRIHTEGYDAAAQ